MRVRGKFVTAVAAAALAHAPTALAATPAETQEIRDNVMLGGMVEHEQKLQQIATAHQGNRAAGTVGYEQSVAYVAKRLEDAGYNVNLSPFDFPTWEESRTPILAQVTPTPTSYVAGGPEDDDTPGVDFITFEFSGSGDVSGARGADQRHRDSAGPERRTPPPAAVNRPTFRPRRRGRSP